jgi:lipoprotein-anchoring transpeptidase ErfK/SrfK
VPDAIGVMTVRTASDGALAQKPWTWLNFRPVLRTIAALLAAAGLACATAPASTPMQAIARGVTVAGIRVGGLTAEPARERVAHAFLRPLRIVTPHGVATIDPARAAAKVDVDAAVSAALRATSGSDIAVPVAYSNAHAARIVAGLAKRYDVAAVDAQVTGATSDGPVFSPARAGRAVDTKTTRAAIGQLLRDGTRAPLHLLTRRVAPKKTVATFGPVIVVTRAANALRLYDGTRLVRTFRVATGQAIYPTPAGIWRIADKQRDPWWYPPTYDAWAKGLKPVPPGPDNPLGTRWMGLNAPGVGIHGTDAPASIGYSASHGCIRMQVPDAEWLFEHVHVGTPVVIL